MCSDTMTCFSIVPLKHHSQLSPLLTVYMLQYTVGQVEQTFKWKPDLEIQHVTKF